MDAELKARDRIDTLIITGTLTNCCCESTARDALQMGYNVIFVTDAGLPSTGSWARHSGRAGGIDLIPERDAPVVARLRPADAVFLSKTNIPAFSHDGGRPLRLGRPDPQRRRPLNRAGASSSGTAMAVSGSFAGVGVAEETGGSIQNSASARSLVGVKPTFALVPDAGVAPLVGSTRDVVGPHARTVVDAGLLLDLLAGYTAVIRASSPRTRSRARTPASTARAGERARSLRGVRLALRQSGGRT